MGNQDRLDDIHRQQEKAEKSLDRAIYDLDRLGIDVDVAARYCLEDSPSYSRDVVKAIRAYVNAKDNLDGLQ